MRSSCTLDRHPVRAVATCFRRSSSDSLPPPEWSTSPDVCSEETSAMAVPAVVSGTVCISMTWPQVSTRWTVLTYTAGCRCAGLSSGFVGLTAVGAGRPTRVAAPMTPPLPPFRCGHGTLPRGMLLYARSSGDPLTADHGDESIDRNTHR